jgi:hypothetical protein
MKKKKREFAGDVSTVVRVQVSPAAPPKLSIDRA